MIGLEQWRAAIGRWHAGNLSAIYRRYGSRRIVCNWTKFLPTIDNYSTAVYYLVYWLIVVLFAVLSEDGLFVAISLHFCDNWSYLTPVPRSPAPVFRGYQNLREFVQPTVTPVLGTGMVYLNRNWKLLGPSLAPTLRQLLALNWLLIVAGDVELNPGPLPADMEKLLETVDASILTEDDLSTVYREILDLASKWMDIALMLGLRYSDLSIICHDNPRHCLREALIQWLKQSYNVEKNGPPTWRKMVEVTAEPAAGSNPALAANLAQKYRGISIVQKTGGTPAITHTRYLQAQKVESSRTEPRLDPRETNHLCLEFATVFRRIIKLLNENVDIEELKEFLDLCSHPLYPEQNYVDRRIYKDAKTPRELLRSLSPQFINYMNYYLLEGIIKEFKCDEGMKILEEYTLKTSIQKRKRKQFLEDLPDPITDSESEQFLGVKRVKLTLDGKMEEATFERLQETQTALQTATGIDTCSTVYSSCDPGSVILNFFIPESICHIFHELNKEDLAIFAGAGILTLEIGEFIIDNVQKYATKESKISQTNAIQAAGESTKPTSLEYYLQERQNEMQSNQYSHMCETLGYISDEKLKELCSDSFLSAYASGLRNWKRIAPYIGLQEWNVQKLVDSYPNDKDRKHVALQSWKRREGDNATYHNLLETLILHGQIEDIETLLYQIGPDLAVTQTSEWLKDKYKCYDSRREWKGVARVMVFNQTLGQFQKDPLNQLSKLDYSVYYETLDQFPTLIASVSLKSIINSITTGTQPILIKGMHGIGVSLLMSRICHYWSHEFGLRSCKLLLWINLGVINNAPATLDHLLQEVLPARLGVQHISKWIEDRGGEDILFILDGWSHEQEEAASSVLSRILSKQYLEKSTVVVTSTFSPSALTSRVADDSDYIQFDMFGLNPKQISQQVTNYFASDSAKSEEILRHMASHSDISQLASIPVCLYGLLYVLECVQESAFPVTWTELFSTLTLLLLSPLFPEYDIKSHLSQYSQNFPHHVPKAVTPFLYSLSGVAYVRLQRGANVFSQELIGSSFPLRASQELTGFVFLHPEHIPLRPDLRNRYLHFTFPLLQDFLAALYVHSLSPVEQIYLMEKRQNLVYLWQFYSGLTPTDQYVRFSFLQNTYCKHDHKKIANCTYEAKLPAEIAVNLSQCSLSRRDVHHLIILSRSLRFRHCNLALVHVSKPHTQILPSKSVAAGGHGLSIVLDECTVSAEGLFLGRMPVQKLSIWQCNIGVDEARALGRTMKVNDILKKLDLRNNKIAADGARTLGEALKMNQSLRILDLGINELGNSGTTAIAEGLRGNKHLEVLRLWTNGISDDGATALAGALNVNQSLKTLGLYNNQITDEGARVISTALRVNQSLTTLNLQRNQITKEGARALGEALRVNRSLRILRLYDNDISSELKKSLLKKFPRVYV